MKERLNNMICLLKKEIGLYLGISFGVFFFILIFKPFPLDHIDFDNRKIFILGLGAIVFLLIFIVRIIFQGLTGNNSRDDHTPLIPYQLSVLFILVFSVVAFSMYLKYAGSVSLSYFLLFRVILICLAPLVILNFYDKMAELKLLNESLILQNKLFQQKIDKNEEDNLSRSIEFISENKSENIRLEIREILFIKSADNYAEIYYLEGDHVKKTLIRNSLKNIELWIKPHPVFIRCHRTCIVNTHFIEKLDGNCNNHTLTILGYPKPIPVSRQYLLIVKEALSTI